MYRNVPKQFSLHDNKRKKERKKVELLQDLKVVTYLQPENANKQQGNLVKTYKANYQGGVSCVGFHTASCLFVRIFSA